jgi:hypothetical protein
MFSSIPFDVAGPGVLVAAAIFGLGALIVITLVISLIESIVLFLFKWDRYGRSLWASILMNVTSSIVGGILVVIGLYQTSISWFVLAFLLSVMIEAGVLVLMKRGAARQNWTVALVANLVSYLFIILPYALLNLQ